MLQRHDGRTAAIDARWARGAGADAVDDLRRDAVLDPLLRSLNASASLLSLHLDGEEHATVLGATGHAASDEGVRVGMLDHAHALVADEADAIGHLGDGVWLEEHDASRPPMLTVMFRDAQPRSRIVLTATFAGRPIPERKLVAATLRRLLPTLEAYFRLWQRARLEAQRSRGLRAALDLIDLGVVLVDRAGDPCFVNAAATALFAEQRFLRLRASGIHANTLGGTLRLQAALSAAVASNEETPCAIPEDERESTLLRLTDGEEHLIVAALPASHPAEDAGAVAAMLVMLKPEGDPEKVAVPACRLFSLSGVETRLACHLVAGRSVSEASAAMRIREATSRGYLKQIFAKTHVNRQADLVRVLLSSIVRARTGGTIQVI